METYEAIMTRRSVPKVSDRAPGTATIEKLLDAAVRAPTHHVTEPWRFIVLRGDALRGLGAAWAAGVERAGKNAEGIAAKALRAPVVIVVIARPKTHLPKVVEVEEHHAIGAAIQNILLAAHALGLGAMVRTGPAATLPEVRDFLHLGDSEHVAGFVYVGYPLDAGDRRRSVAALALPRSRSGATPSATLSSRLLSSPRPNAPAPGPRPRPLRRTPAPPRSALARTHPTPGRRRPGAP